MANFNQYKTGNLAFFGTGPAWKLNFAGNVWDAIIDIIALLSAYYARAEATVAVTWTSSPFTYTAGSNGVLYIRGGVISAIEKKDSTGAWVSILTQAPATVFLAAAQQVRITASSAPTLTFDAVDMFNNAAGAVAAVTPGASPYTYTNTETRSVVVYLSGGAVTSITRNGIAITDALPVSVLLQPLGAVVVTYTSAPTMIKDS